MHPTTRDGLSEYVDYADIIKEVLGEEFGRVKLTGNNYNTTFWEVGKENGPNALSIKLERDKTIGTIYKYNRLSDFEYGWEATVKLLNKNVEASGKFSKEKDETCRLALLCALDELVVQIHKRKEALDEDLSSLKTILKREVKEDDME